MVSVAHGFRPRLKCRVETNSTTYLLNPSTQFMRNVKTCGPSCVCSRIRKRSPSAVTSYSERSAAAGLSDVLNSARAAPNVDVSPAGSLDRHHRPIRSQIEQLWPPGAHFGWTPPPTDTCRLSVKSRKTGDPYSHASDSSELNAIHARQVRPAFDLPEYGVSASSSSFRGPVIGEGEHPRPKLLNTRKRPRRSNRRHTSLRSFRVVALPSRSTRSLTKGAIAPPP